MPSDWKQKRSVPLMVLSPTQFEEAELCVRKWWLHRVRGLQVPTATGSQVFGTVLHSVIERYLSADEIGTVPCSTCHGSNFYGDDVCSACEGHGRVPVDLYPPGWTNATNRWGKSDGTITPAEGDVIQRLVGQAIESGVIERLPDRLLEHEIKIPLVTLPCGPCQGAGCEKCEGTGKGTQVNFTGFSDYLTPEGVQDHKSTSSMKWAKSPEALR